MVWFHQVDCKFALTGITTQATKYYHIVSILPQELAIELINILSSPLAENAYDLFRAAIL